MANESIYIDTSGFAKISDKLKEMPKVIAETVDKTLNANALEIATEAKRLAPVNIGGLQNSISADNSQLLRKTISVNAGYAAFVEFGTGRYAAQYVSGLPADWQQFALKFKGQKGSGTMQELFAKIIQWVKAKGLHGLTASGRSKTGKKAERDILEIAYAITIRILRHGIKKHPFLFPAYEKQRPIIK